MGEKKVVRWIGVMFLTCLFLIAVFGMTSMIGKLICTAIFLVTFLGMFIVCTYKINGKNTDLDIKDQIIQNSPVCFAYTDHQFNILYANKAFERSIGWLPSECNFLELSDFFEPKIEAMMGFAFENLGFWKGEITIRRKNGESFWAIASIVPVKEKEKNRYILSIEDITNRKYYEKQLEEKNFEQQKTFSQLQDVQVKLIQQEKLAAIGHLAAGIAHEINNPLSFIYSNFDFLEQYFKKWVELMALHQIDTSPYREMIQDTTDIFIDSKDGFHRINQIVNELRNFARGEQHYHMEKIQIEEAMESTLIILKNAIKYVAVVEKNYSETPKIEVCKNQINQVFLNILVNALHAIEEKKREEKGVIKVKSYFEEGNVYMSIEDNGIGIKTELLSDIFNPFFTTKEIGKGTGLGLSISYDIIHNKYGGEILVETSEQKGTIFTIKLPLRQED